MTARRWLVTAAIGVSAVIWTGTIAATYRAVRAFESTPGLPANAPRSWPVGSAVPRTAGEWSLVMLVHPHCSCSRASVSELRAVLEKAPASVKTSVLVYRPSELAPGWEQTEVVRSASRLRRARVMIDRDGREAALFGGFTSGQTFLYDDRGRLRFAGGITSLRGHAGLNRGRTDIIDIAHARAGSGTHPVFGCAIATPNPRKTP
ncbi:MAG TPA: RedB protein [Thermoanaerobaculia bacterium]|nr:RedB protein [Thermoanaerobaculia bacterium]